MSDAIAFYNKLTKMSDEKLQAYELEVLTNLSDLTKEYSDHIKTGIWNGRLEGIYEDTHTNCFLDLLTIRSYMLERKLSVPVRDISSFMIVVQALKDKRGF